MKNNILTIISFFIILDIFGFIMWTLSYQTPSGFYIGVLTQSLINLIF